MKKLLLMLVLLFMFGSGLHAQQLLNFAPVGAEWYYDRGMTGPSLSATFFKRFQCIGTTEIDGKECRVIQQYYKYDCEGNTIDSVLNRYLYVDSLQVYEVENNNFYLLYDFSKTVGEYWVIPEHWVYPPYNDTIFVDSIKPFVLTNGDTCQAFWVTNTLRNYAYYYRIILTRFGGTNGLFHTLQLSGCGDGDLRCYLEDSILVYKDYYRECDYSYITGGIPESITPDIMIPNPVSDHITILTSNNKIPIKSIEIYSMTGQFILSVSHPSRENITIPFSQYHNGMYIMKILWQDQSCKTYKIIKL